MPKPKTFAEWSSLVMSDPSYDGSGWSECPATVEETRLLTKTLRALYEDDRLDSPESAFLLSAIDVGMLELDEKAKKELEALLIEMLGKAPSPMCTEAARALVAIDSGEGLRVIAEAIATAVAKQTPNRFAESFVLRRITLTKHRDVLFPTLDKVLKAPPNPEDPDWQPDVVAHVADLKRRLST